MNRAKKFLNKIVEVNPLQLGRVGVKGTTVDSVVRKINALKSEIDTVVDDFIPSEDDPKAHSSLKDASKLLAKAASTLKKVKGKR